MNKAHVVIYFNFIIQFHLWLVQISLFDFKTTITMCCHLLYKRNCKRNGEEKLYCMILYHCRVFCASHYANPSAITVSFLFFILFLPRKYPENIFNNSLSFITMNYIIAMWSFVLLLCKAMRMIYFMIMIKNY